MRRLPLCHHIAYCGPASAPLACGFPEGHAGQHAWEYLRGLGVTVKAEYTPIRSSEGRVEDRAEARR